MSYAIVFSSRTGNTALLAQTIWDTLPGDCLYFGTPDPKALEAETVYVGFWTDKGSCDESIAQFLKNPHQSEGIFVWYRWIWRLSGIL